MSKIINVGRVTAYAEAVAGGYTGTIEEWERDLANLGTTAAEVEANRQAVAEDKAAVEGDVTTVETYKNSAAQSASEALQSAESAHTDALAATAAKEAAQTAQGSAVEAKEAAVSAKTSAENAQTEADQSARAAAGSALVAGEAAQTAVNSAAAAAQSEQNISESAEQIEINKNDITDLKSALDQNLLDKYITEEPTNWYNPAEVESGEIYKDGSFHASTSRSHTGYIPCTEGDKLQIFRTNAIGAVYRRHVAFYTSEKVAMNQGSDSTNDAPITVPSGSAFAIMTFDNTLISTTFNIIIVRDGIKPSSYTPYFDPYKVLAEDFITPETAQIVNKVKDKELSTTDLINRYGCALPRSVLRQTIGLPEIWYNANMGTPQGLNYAVTNVGNPLPLTNKGVSFTNTEALNSSYGYYWTMFDVLLNPIRIENASGNGYPRKIIAENLSDCSLLAIGDSTVDSDYLTGGLLAYFTSKGHTITLLGTLGDGTPTNKNEGRSGWKASDYLTDKTYDGVVNPFYNPATQTFDFGYYMTNQGYSAPTFVVIQLGINDLYNSYSTSGIVESTWDCINTMCESILDYDSGIKIIINLPTPPNSDLSTHVTTPFLYQNILVKYIDYALTQIAQLSDASIRASYCHLILDPDTDLRDRVHPTTDGYGKMAKEIVNQINCWQNGV